MRATRERDVCTQVEADSSTKLVKVKLVSVSMRDSDSLDGVCLCCRIRDGSMPMGLTL